MIGGGPKEHVIGAVAGGVVGGVVGNALSPQTAEKMKTLVGKMCRGLPGG
jgi:outer membrane lipoprotein SlyB